MATTKKKGKEREGSRWKKEGLETYGIGDVVGLGLQFIQEWLKCCDIKLVLRTFYEYMDVDERKETTLINDGCVAKDIKI